MTVRAVARREPCGRVHHECRGALEAQAIGRGKRFAPAGEPRVIFVEQRFGDAQRPAGLLRRRSAQRAADLHEVPRAQDALRDLRPCRAAAGRSSGSRPAASTRPSRSASGFSCRACEHARGDGVRGLERQALLRVSVSASSRRRRPALARSRLEPHRIELRPSESPAATSPNARTASRNIDDTSGCRSSSVSTMSPNGRVVDGR